MAEETFSHGIETLERMKDGRKFVALDDLIAFVRAHEKRQTSEQRHNRASMCREILTGLEDLL